MQISTIFDSLAATNLLAVTWGRATVSPIESNCRGNLLSIYIVYKEYQILYYAKY